MFGLFFPLAAAGFPADVAPGTVAAAAAARHIVALFRQLLKKIKGKTILKTNPIDFELFERAEKCLLDINVAFICLIEKQYNRLQLAKSVH